MRWEDISKLFQRDPALLRLHLVGGQQFEIADPDLVVLDRTVIEILLPPYGRKGREAVIGLLHIVWIEVISTDD